MASALDLRRVRRPRSVGRDRVLGLGLLLALLGWAGAALAQPTQSPEAPSVPEGEGSEPVTCLLPAAIDRLGRALQAALLLDGAAASARTH